MWWTPTTAPDWSGPYTRSHERRFEFDSNVYIMPDSAATLFAEHLRRYSAGNFFGDLSRLAESPGVAPDWLDGARALADIIEDTHPAGRTEPIPLEGKAADAAHAVLLTIVHTGDLPDDPPGADALLTALRSRIKA